MYGTPAAILNPVRTFTRALALKLCAAVAVVALSSGFYLGWTLRGATAASSQLRVERAVQRDATAERGRQHEIATRNARREQTIRQEFQEGSDALDRFLSTRPDLRDVDIGDDGLRLWNSWNAGRGLPSTGGEPAGADPAGAAGAQREAAGPDGQPPGDGGAADGVPPTARGPG